MIIGVRSLVDNTDVHLVPSLNPDGCEAGTRHNVHDVDLNRGFPGWRDEGRLHNDLLRGREKEVRAVMSWSQSHNFVLSISFHDGQVLINYPWDDAPDAVEGERSVCGDDDVFKHVSSLYADNHPFMWTGQCLCHSETFSSGISNGAEWYLVDNGMQDYNYLFTNCMEVTAELSCSKRPEPSKLQTEWENNLDSMLIYLGAVHAGVKGRVFDDQGEAVEGAFVEVVGRDKMMKTSRRGEYWRLLLPGSYKMRAHHENKFGRLESEEVDVEITKNPGGGALALNFFMKYSVTRSFTVSSFLNHEDSSDEVLDLFTTCDVLDIRRGEVKYVRLKETVFHVTVKINLDHVQHILTISRPETDQQLLVLNEAVDKYCSETLCGEFDSWKVTLLTK